MKSLAKSGSRSSAAAVAESSTPARTPRNTRQRQAVLRAVRALDGRHPTAAEVFSAVQAEEPGMSLATVYRALHALAQNGDLREMRVENVARYDGGMAAHHHLVCRRCGAVADLPADALPAGSLRQIGRTVEKSAEFFVDLYPIQFSGVCASCASAR